MARQRRTTTKTGPNSRRTVTYTKNGGVRITNTNKPSPNSSRVTISTNLSNGNRRVTHSRKLGGGWWDRTTKSKNTINKWRSSKSGSRSGSGNYNYDDSGADFFVDRIDSSQFKWWGKILWFFVKPVLFLVELALVLIYAALLYLLFWFILFIGGLFVLWLIWIFLL
jgi:hypothetical protein